MKIFKMLLACAALALNSMCASPDAQTDPNGVCQTETGGGQSIYTGKKLDVSSSAQYRLQSVEIVITQLPFPEIGGVKLPPDGKKVDVVASDGSISERVIHEFYMEQSTNDTGGVVTADKGSKKFDCQAM